MARVLAGARQLEPLVQGDLSRLCGLYSILNAIQLGLYPRWLSPVQRKQMFIEGITHLARERQLRSVVGVGMEEPVWRKLAVALVTNANEQFGSKLKVQRALKGTAPRSRRKVLEAIMAAVEDGRPVLVYLGGALDHYTVIAGYTDRRLMLFDSQGLRWIEIDHVGVAEGRRHWLEPTWTYSLCRIR